MRAPQDLLLLAALSEHTCSGSAGPHIGATLMHRLAAFTGGSAVPSPLATLVRNFQERVQRELPSMYVWFAEQSLHVTLRALES